MTRQKIARKDSTSWARREFFRRARESRRICARIAQELEVTVVHVYRVAHGERTSRRIEAALDREIEKIERGSAA